MKVGVLSTESNQRNTGFPCQNLFVGNIPNTKEHREQSHQSTSNYNALRSIKQDSEIFSTTLYYIYYTFKKICFLFMFACIYVCMCTMCMPGAQGGQKRVSPGTGVTDCCEHHHMDSGNHTQSSAIAAGTLS
jgi:hypothetical protein